MEYSNFSSRLIHWYQANKRELPWRNTSDPYKIWLSEVMLQQTRVNQGLPYYLRFVEAFPKVNDMADAPEDKILRLWQGLGYYSRAKNLHRCAKTIVNNFGGEFPEEFSVLLKLPGIGPYTAAAVASIAFNQAHPVVDGNVQRVLSRYLGVEDNIVEPATQKKFQTALGDLIDKKQPGLFNQAIMELGAMVCKPKNPACEECPVGDACFANLHKQQDRLPFKIKKLKRRSRYFYYWVMIHHGKIALRKRDAKNIWKGLYEFYLVERNEISEWRQATDDLLEKMLEEEQDFDFFEAQKHVLTHQDIYSFFVVTKISKRQKQMIEEKGGYAFYSTKEIMELPKPILIDKFLREKIFD